MRNFATMSVAAVLGGFALSALNPFDNSAKAIESKQKPVLELFTSQGCSSCPPADALLRKYIARGDVIALSLAVDYWDRLGWKDTFGSPAHSARQRAYARGRGDGEVYTPQMVINGRSHAVGSNAGSIDRVLSRTNTKLNASRVALSAKLSGDNLVIHIGNAHAGNSAKSANVILALVQDRGRVNIKRGENSGRQISYHNVVRDLQQIGSWHGKGKTLRLAGSKFKNSCCESVVVMLQQTQGGPILAAAQLRIR